MGGGLPRYVGKAFARMDDADGGLPPVIGASNFQVTRANRGQPQLSDGRGNTYNHAPMLTYWKNTFYLQYLSSPVDEHQSPGLSFLCCSEDGVHWSAPETCFPEMPVPPGEYTCIDGEIIIVPEGRMAIMHQRMAFFHTGDDRLLVTGFYGQVDNIHQCPFENRGIARVVREIYGGHRLGPVYLLHVLADSGWRAERLPFPHFSQSGDSGFVAACHELLSDSLHTQQWAEEHGLRDPLITHKAFASLEDGREKPLQAFCWYHINETTIAALFKHSMVGVSRDAGQTWQIKKEPGFVTSGGKMWGQKTPDGRFAVAYSNSLASEHRYPLVMATGEDGLVFDELGVIFGEVPPRRYQGVNKDFGPQYVRGICEGHKDYPEGAVWLCHSVNKEDIWVTRVPVPVKQIESRHLKERFDTNALYPSDWNIYSPLWAAVYVTTHLGNAALCLSDSEPADYARAARVFPESVYLSISLSFSAAAFYEMPLEIELVSPEGIVAVRLLYDGKSLAAQTTSVVIPLTSFEEAGAWRNLSVQADCERSLFTVSLDDRPLNQKPLLMVQKVNSVQRIVFRTKCARKAPGMTTRPDQPDLPDCERKTARRAFFIRSLMTGPGVPLAD